MSLKQATHEDLAGRNAITFDNNKHTACCNHFLKSYTGFIPENTLDSPLNLLQTYFRSTKHGLTLVKKI